jgi:hypothetical protein
MEALPVGGAFFVVIIASLRSGVRERTGARRGNPR